VWLKQSSSIFWTISLVIFMASNWPAQSRASEKKSAEETLKKGQVAPVFSMRVINSKESGISFFSLDDFVGPEEKKHTKLMVLSFFATYCEPCKKELPVLEKLWERYKKDGLMVAVVSIDKGTGQAGGIKELINRKHLTYPVIHDKFQILAKRYHVGRLPYLTLIGKDGKIKMLNVGYTESFTKKLVGIIQKELGEKPVSFEEIIGTKKSGN